MITATLPLLLVAGALAPAQEDAPAPADAGRMFQKNCLACHQPPDLDYAADRAWLAQVRDTA